MKVKELRELYKNKISENTIENIIARDTTPTKKYAAYMAKQYMLTTDFYGVVDLVKKFDELLPYIENKDIYSQEYAQIQNLRKVIEVADIRKNLKLDKEKMAKQIFVLKETEDYILLHPKTHNASCKYGYSTKWCVTYHSDSYFNSYKDNLVFLIMKKKIDSPNFQKVAFHRERKSERIDIFNQADSRTSIEYTARQMGEDINFDEIIELCTQFFNRGKYKFFKRFMPWTMYYKSLK